ncbi:MAG: signal recognition particle protein, partial [Acidimicrobiales bacterium]
VEAIIRSMTTEERSKPEIIDTGRRGRIATGSGTRPNEVSNLIKQFKEMQKMMKRMGGMGTKKMKKVTQKGKKGRKGKGGRTTPKGGRTTEKGSAGLTLPGLNEDGGFDLSELEGIPGFNKP